MQTFLARLATAQIPGVHIDDIGMTTWGRRLLFVRVTDPEACPQDGLPTILITAGEHATEHAANWVAHGMLASLLRDTTTVQACRTGRTWLFILIQDPDGNVDSVYNRLTNTFVFGASVGPPEVTAYTRYLQRWVDSGNTLSHAIVLHNVEANECPHVFCPFIHHLWIDTVIACNDALFERAREAGFRTARPDQRWSDGAVPQRLFGWCAERLGAMDLAYEVNDRYSRYRLTLTDLHRLGAVLLEHFAVWRWCAEMNSESESFPGVRTTRIDAKGQAVEWGVIR